MTRFRWLSAALLPVLLAVVLLGSAPVDAASRAVSDPPGNAPAALDITSVRYTNSNTSVAFLWHLRKVTNATRLIGTTLDECPACNSYYQYWVGRVNGHPKVRVYRGVTAGLRQRTCPGAKVIWSPGRHLVRVRVPKRCIVGPLALFMQSWSVVKWAGPAVDVTRGRTVPRG